MASRRRLDISSLLCDDKDDSSSKPDTHLPRPPAQSPVHSQRHPHPTTIGSASFSFPPNEQSALAETPRLHGSLQQEQAERHYQKQEREGNLSWTTSSNRESHRQVQSASALLPLVLQASQTHRRSPSPHYSLPPASPVDHIGPVHRGLHSDGLREPGFPRPGSSTAPVDFVETHPHYNQISQPPFTAPVDIHNTLSARRASAKLNLHQYSPMSQPHLSPLSPVNFPSSARPVSLSPTDLSRSARPSTASSSERHSRHSPVLSRPPDSTMHPSRRVSASLSPTVPKSGLSGLDALVQAATEERERIDVHRRLSGGEESLPSFNYTSSVRPASLSPVGRRSKEILHVPPPTPPYTASSQSIDYHSINYADTRHKEQGFEENVPETARHRPSPESSHLQQANISQDVQYSPRTIQAISPRVSRRQSNSPESAYVKYEPQSRTPTEALAASSISSQISPASMSESLYATSSSAHVPFQKTTLKFENEERGAAVDHPHLLSPVEPATLPQIRRSPPRSRPKPKKPGSAALAMMEQELRGVALIDKNQRESIEAHNDIAVRKDGQRIGLSRPQLETEHPEINSRSLQSNERGVAEDEEVNDFFLSTFDSPRSAEKRVSPKASHPTVTSSAQIREDEHAAERWRYAPVRHHDAASLALSSVTPGSIPGKTSEMSDQLYSARDALGQDDEETMSDVEAEILDELVDAADAATSEDERTEYDDQETANMEVDVDNELLELVDGPSEPSPKSKFNSKPPTRHSRAFPGIDWDTDFDRTSMPPPDALQLRNVQNKDTKGVTRKLKTKAKVNDAIGSTKSAQTHEEKTSAKATKTKPGSKARPTKGGHANKVKGKHQTKEASTPASASFSMSPFPIPASGTPTDEVFPVVTSSGRMVTKSKKVAASTATTAGPSGQPSHNGRKKTAVTGVKDSSGSRSGSRSRSVAPRASVDPESRREKVTKDVEEKTKEKENATEEAGEGEEDKLYCICRTHYDEDRVMIACDRCDEWYHTHCVGMPDLLIDLVDQFICSNCIAQNPGLNLQTTYKQRCFAGLKHPDPDSPDACHKPSRGAFSKYCSDECGVRYMHRKIQAWADTGGDIRGLWESVKGAKRREGFVMREPGRTLPKAILAEIHNNAVSNLPGSAPEARQVVVDEEGRNSIVTRLEEQLQVVVQEREEIKQELQLLSWRERLLQLASERADNVGECGWDQRLLYGDEEWVEFGAGVLESYEESTPNGHSEENGENGENGDMDVDGQAVAGLWWCRGKKKCERHQGWQRIRAADLEKERDSKETALADLTTREREIRSRIEDILHPQSRPIGTLPEATFKFKLGSEPPTKKTKKKAAPIPVQ